jgi:cytochrome c-type biogenesis protein CcsB
MIFNTLEQILIQFSFVIFFVVTLFSWVKITLYEKKTIFLPNSSNNFFFYWIIDESFLGIFLGFISVTGLCLIRWNLSNHLPLSNLYESSLFLAWSIIFLYLILKLKMKNDWIDAIIAPIILMTTTFSTLGLPKQLQEASALVPALQSNWLMMHVSMMILSYGALIFGSLLSVTLLTITFFSTEIEISKAPFFLSNRNNQPRIREIFSTNRYQLEPSQKKENFFENWKWKNYSQTFFSTQGFLIKTFQEQNWKDKIQEETQETEKIFNQPITISSFSSLETKNNLENIPIGVPLTSRDTVWEGNLLKFIFLQKYKTNLINQIDYWSYRIIGIGFPLLTLGILSGAVWANEAWGSYWNWDPKETWALITWVIFAIYLHVRITKGWNGTKPALVALLGFFVVWICYLGVNLLGKGLHSYGWIN